MPSHSNSFGNNAEKDTAGCRASDRKYIVIGKEKRAVAGTHEALVDEEVFESIQKSFQARAFNIASKGQFTENILKGKVFCGCCGGKMQRKRGSDHADWYFFTCITKNRLGTDKCTGMYVREEDIFRAIYHQLKPYIDEHFISAPQYKQQIRQFDEQIEQAARCLYEARENFRLCYEGVVEGRNNAEDLQIQRETVSLATAHLDGLCANKAAYEKQYQVFRKLLSASCKETPLDEIKDYIDKIVVDMGKHIVIKWKT